ncbi:putative alkylphosphonate uptake protein [Pseudomonas aeruginosa]|nr:putative alkylphosphonate uptake protein [Pseudomonas aeruginosa]
MKLKSEFVRKV